MAKEYVTPPIVEEVRKTPEYKALLELGLDDTSSSLIVKNSNFRFSGPLLGLNNVYNWSSRDYPRFENTLTVYSNGYVRTDRGRPAPVPSLKTGDLVTLRDWRDKLEDVRLFVLRNCILKDHLGVSSRKEQIELTQGDNSKFVQSAMYKLNVEFFPFINEFMPELVKYATPESLAKKIMENPGKATGIMKKQGLKNDTVKKAIELLPDSIRAGFEEELGVRTDLNDIGF